MERITEFGMPVRFLTVTDRAGYLPAIRYARRGAVIVVFADLPPRYGKPARCRSSAYRPRSPSASTAWRT